jgi:nucleoid-associated protein YgaU
MRQFVFGLLVAGGLYWGYSAYAGDPKTVGDRPAAEPTAGGAQTPAEAVDLSRMLGAPAGSNQAPVPTAAGGPLAAREGDAAPAVAGVEQLLAGIGQRQPESITTGWSLLARCRPGPERQRLAGALVPVGNDFVKLLAALGSDNSFLHSAEGRQACSQAAGSVSSMADADATLAGSVLIGLMLRGRIERSDTDARACVDDFYRQHRIRVDRWLCDPANVARARSYTVVSGDSLARIAKRFRQDNVMVEDGTLAVLNRIHNPNSLQVGQKIKVPIDPICAVVEKRSFSMVVYVGDHLMRLYWVGHGENDKTPIAEFTVAEKQPRPEWTAPDGNRYPYGHPQNILGEYFIKFRHDRYTGFGAHGTPMPETICTMSSMGCIRMLAPDIADLFLLLPRGAKVYIRASQSMT